VVVGAPGSAGAPVVDAALVGLVGAACSPADGTGARWTGRHSAARALEADDAIDGLATYGGLADEFEAELGEECDCRGEVLDHDAGVVHAKNAHASMLPMESLHGGSLAAVHFLNLRADRSYQTKWARTSEPGDSPKRVEGSVTAPWPTMSR
jgi:hypothetical protein